MKITTRKYCASIIRNFVILLIITFTPTVFSAEQLYISWKANDPSNRIWYSASSNGTSWPNGTVINTRDSTSAGSAIVSFKGQLYTIWKANDSSNRIWYSASSNGTSWPNGKTINNVDSTSAEPAAIVFNDMLYIFWKANDSSNRIYYSASADGRTWPNGKVINNRDSTSAGLAVAVYNNELYVIWKANDRSNKIWFSNSIDGNTWPNGKTINNTDSTSAAPAATVFNSMLYIGWKANDSSNRIWYSASTNGTSWPNGKTINNTDSTSAAPALVLYNNQLYFIWKANDASNRMWYSASSSGTSWPNGKTINNTDSTSARPAATVFGNISLDDLTIKGATVPGELPTGISHTELANFAWRSFIALNNFAATPLPASRGDSNPSTSFANSGVSGVTQPLVWETLAHRTELFPKSGAKPQPWGSTPKYTYNETVTIPKGVDYTLYNNLDEASQIGQNTLFFPKNPPNPAMNGKNYDPNADVQVLFEAKVNETEYNYVYNGQVTSPVVLPNGSLEVKAAWRKLTADMDASRYHTAKIINYTGTDENPIAANDTYALIALHIIHKTPNYPTFIFATFEQIDSMQTPEGKDTGLYFVTSYANVAYETTPTPPTATYSNGNHTTTTDLPIGAVNLPTAKVASGSQGIPVGHAGPVKVVQPATYTEDVADVNANVLNLMNRSSAFNNSIWKYYHLKGVQGVPTSNETNLDFYLANIVVESSQPGIQLFKGNISMKKNNAAGNYTFTNTREDSGSLNVYYPSYSNPIHKYTMGGCMGCHGVAQTALQNDFSFLFSSYNTGFSNPDAMGLPSPEVMSERAESYKNSQ